MKTRIGFALIVLFLAGVAVGSQEVRRPKEAYLMIHGLPEAKVRVTVNVPGKKPLAVTLQGVPGSMVLSYEGKSTDPKDAILVKDVRMIRIEDEGR
jgi:hypothetical protein